MPKHDIKEFIDFFFEASKKIRGISPQFERGKDGNHVKSALKTFSREQLEMLAIWFLAKKTKLHPRIGTMLSKKLLEELSREIKDPKFWKELDQIMEKYYPRQLSLDELKRVYDSAERK